jgi:Anti-sigma-28 factor, FlgM
MRIFSLNKARKSWELFDATESLEKPRPAQVRLCKVNPCKVKMSCFAFTADSPAAGRRAFRRGAIGFQKSSPHPSDGRMDVRKERIAAIRAAIAQGSYHVPAADLAQKLIDHMLAHQRSKN